MHTIQSGLHGRPADSDLRSHFSVFKGRSSQSPMWIGFFH